MQVASVRIQDEKESLMVRPGWGRWAMNASLIVLTAGLFACGGDEAVLALALVVEVPLEEWEP